MWKQKFLHGRRDERFGHSKGRRPQQWAARRCSVDLLSRLGDSRPAALPPAQSGCPTAARRQHAGFIGSDCDAG